MKKAINTTIKLLKTLNYLLVILDVYVISGLSTEILNTEIGKWTFGSVLYLVVIYVRYKIIFKDIANYANNKQQAKSSTTKNKHETERLNKLKSQNNSNTSESLLKPSKGIKKPQNIKSRLAVAKEETASKPNQEVEPQATEEPVKVPPVDENFGRKLKTAAEDNDEKDDVFANL